MPAKPATNLVRDKMLALLLPVQILDEATPIILSAQRNLSETVRVVLVDFSRSLNDSDPVQVRSPFDPSEIEKFLPDYLMAPRRHNHKDPAITGLPPVPKRRLGLWLSQQEHANLTAALKQRALDPANNHPGTGEKWYANEVAYAGLLKIINTPAGVPLPFL